MLTSSPSIYGSPSSRARNLATVVLPQPAGPVTIHMWRCRWFLSISWCGIKVEEGVKVPFVFVLAMVLLRVAYLLAILSPCGSIMLSSASILVDRTGRMQVYIVSYGDGSVVVVLKGAHDSRASGRGRQVGGGESRSRSRS